MSTDHILHPILLVGGSGMAGRWTARFLRDAHTSACRIFGTVLGPEANKAHSNHFHIAMAQRDRGNYCR